MATSKKKKKKRSNRGSNKLDLGVSENDALRYHEYSTSRDDVRQPGKIEVVPTKSTRTQRDLSLAYTPGVAAACLEIAKNPQKAADYTARSNLVAVISNGTAVLGLGNIGPLASKPVMEGKAVLFKKFANVDVFDIELNADKPEEMIAACKMLEPSIGGINLEDIKAPECFEIEETLKKALNIPVFHDDQHGTAIILVAALMNALKIAKKKASQIKVVFSGAGAAAIACANLIQKIGVQKKNIIMCDKSGVIHTGRDDLDPFKQKYAVKTRLRSLTQAMKGADVFVGLSVGGIVKAPMLKSMAKKPIIFALANPVPEIGYDEAKKTRKDAIVATGRSDFPNQINNVLGFPYIFRGALDVVSKEINDKMKLAAAKALAQLAQEQVPESVSKAYGGDVFKFGPDYLIPKPFDTRALYWVAPAVAQAAIDSKVATRKIDLDAYRDRLQRTVDSSGALLSSINQKARSKARKIVFPEGDERKIIRAADVLIQESLAHPILLGKKADIEKAAKELNIDCKKMTLIDPTQDKRMDKYSQKYYEMRKRKGMSFEMAQKSLARRTYFGLMMTDDGAADCMVSGLTKSYPETIRPALQIIKMKPEYQYAAGLYMILIRDRVLFFADTTVNIEPSAEALAEITLQSAKRVELFEMRPKIALLSFSNFGSSPHPINDKIKKALKIVKEKRPDLEVDGEMQADTAVAEELLQGYPFSDLKEPANLLIFPNLASGNMAYKLLRQLAHAEVIGPVLMGPRKPVHILQRGCSVEEIVNMATIAAAEANEV